MATRPSLLYISPVLPALTGNGLAMRAGIVLEALARHYCVTLRVVPFYAAPDDRLEPSLAEMCVRERRFLRSRRYDVVHAFRLATAPEAESVGAETRHIDLDEVDSATHRKLAALYRTNGADGEARLMEGYAARYESLERQVIGEWDRVYVASQAESELLRRLGPADVRLLPNAVRLPDAPLPPSRRTLDFTLLFVGTLGYVANEDAVRYLCEEILPLLASAGKRVRVVVAGSGATAELTRSVPRGNVQFLGHVPDLAPCYREADAVVAPLRAGGGTRIKIIEAFAYGRPVVSTSTGCAGLEVRNEEHLLIGDTAAAFAGRCRQLMDDPALAQRLTVAAAALVRRSHTLDAIAPVLDPAAIAPLTTARGVGSPPFAS